MTNCTHGALCVLKQSQYRYESLQGCAVVPWPSFTFQPSPPNLRPRQSRLGASSHNYTYNNSTAVQLPLALDSRMMCCRSSTNTYGVTHSSAGAYNHGTDSYMRYTLRGKLALCASLRQWVRCAILERPRLPVGRRVR